MAETREFLVVIDGRESVSPAAGKASDSLGKLGDKAKKTEQDFTGLDEKLKSHAKTISELRQEIAKTGDTSLFGNLNRQQRDFDKLAALRKKLMDEGGPAATGFFAQFVGRLGPLVANMPISGPLGIGLAAAATAAAPAIGATIAGAVVGGAGIGGVVGGALLASKDPAVKAAFSDLGDDIGNDLRDAARPFVPAMLDAAKRVRSGFGPIRDDLKRIFSVSATYVAPLTDAALRAGKSITGGLEKIFSSGAGLAAVQALADGVEDLGATLGDLFSDLSDDGPEAAAALSDAFKVLNVTLGGTAKIIEGLTNAYGFLRKNQGIIGDWLNPYVDKVPEATEVTDEFGAAIQGVGSAAYETSSLVDLLTGAMDKQVDGAIDAAQANLDYRKSLVDAKEAIDKKKGVSLEEEGALLRLAQRTNELTRKTDENSESAATAKKRYDDATEAFINTAMKMGYTRQQAAKLSDEMLKIPKKIATQVILNEAGAKIQVRNIQKAINGIDGKTVYINVIRQGDDQGAMHGPARRASGGPVKAGEIYQVGENGPELMVAPRDGYVINNRDSAMLAAGATARPVATSPAVGGTVQNGSMLVTIDLMGILRKVVRVQYGGNVQLALGTG